MPTGSAIPAVIANPRIDADRRRELNFAYAQTTVIAVVLSVLVVTVSVNFATWAFLEAGALFCACYRTWALDRFSPHDYDIYGRIAVARQLPSLLAALQAGDELAKWPDRADVIHKIHAAGAQRQATAARILRSAGYPHRVPIPVAALAGTIVSFSAGIVLGAWLQGQAALQRPFRPLCGIPVSSSVERAVLALGMWQFWFCVLLLAVFKAWAWRRNRHQIGLIDAAFATTQGAAAQLADISKNGYRYRRMAIARDLDRIANLIGMSVTGAATVLEISNADDTAAGSVPPWLSRLSLSTPNELSKNQLLFVLGLWWGLTIPYLLHFACSGL